MGRPPVRETLGQKPPFRAPVFVRTHHARPPLEKDDGPSFTCVTDGVESALEQAREAADERRSAVDHH
ncbi:hypothetical protein [Natrialba sp. PRR66]|uniref:hypothetical protein n=1 Tax=Natrialba sp. PRR66 TaxID=3098146 RepID=UPI002B1DAB01|nr:hypothetical protein [Natrialba sp. PRR66]